MLIEEELANFLERSIRTNDNKVRDKNLILCHYGLGEGSLPTLEELANRFGLNNRERARQVIKAKFQHVADAASLPRASLVASIIEQVDFVQARQLAESLRAAGLVGGELHPRILLNYLQDIGLTADFDVCDAKLKAITRSSLRAQGECFLVRSSRIQPLRRARNAAATLPGLLGLANVDYIKNELHEYDEAMPSQVLALLEADAEVCFVTESGETWFAIDERDNTLINSCEKLFGVISKCDLDVLATVLENSLSRRTVPHPYPNAKIVRKFLQASRKFDTQGTSVSFLGNATELTPIEHDVVAFLRKQDVVDYPGIRDYLLSRGYGKPHIDKAVTCSPLVFVDKSLGRTRYTYRLVPETGPIEPPLVEHYSKIRERLKQVAELDTDADYEGTRRREQHILQDWLFSGKDVEQCAICGNAYSRSALVAAHKKPRSICSEAERLDPYIVMPLCVFGCDYLYERKHLVILTDTVSLGVPLGDTHEASFARSLVGRKISEHWLRGDPAYFASVT